MSENSLLCKRDNCQKALVNLRLIRQAEALPLSLSQLLPTALPLLVTHLPVEAAEREGKRRAREC